MREMALWVSGAAMAFFVTAGAFLLLANLATVPSERSLTPDPSSKRPRLALDLNEERLASLSARPGQSLDLTVRNDGDEALSDVNLTLGVSSENTALPQTRYYHRTVERLSAGEAVSVRFQFDLSDLDQPRPPAAEPSRKIIEVRASTPKGVPTVRTVILPP